MVSQVNEAVNALEPDLTDTVLTKAVVALSLGAFARAISQRVMDPLLPRLASEFGIPLGNAAWMITCFTLGYALCAFATSGIAATGWLVGHTGTANVIVLSAGGVALVALNFAHRKRRL